MQKPTETITSRQNPLISLTVSLAGRKFREAEKLFRFDGKKLFLEALDGGLPLKAILFRESSAAELIGAAGARSAPEGCRLVTLSDALFDRISEERSPEGVICLSGYLDKIHKIVTADRKDGFSDLLGQGNTLFLESIRDPGNLGTVIRSARAFGLENLVLSADCADPYHPRVIRGAMGALFHQKLILVEPADVPWAIGELRRRGKVYAAALRRDAAELASFSFGAGDTVLVGNEGHGLTEGALAAADSCLFIPMEPGVESLNAGVAASLILFEFYKGGRRG